MLKNTLVQLHPRASKRKPRVSVVIPTYNEAKNLPHVFGLLPDDLHEVIVVDGRSVDDTIEVARSLRPDVVIVRQNRIGKGNAMACGFAAVTGDIVVMLDADGSADPREIERYVAALVDGADFAKGTRFASGGGSADITKVRAWGNRWLNRIANTLFGTRYTDLCYGYNAFWAHCLPALELDERDRGSSAKLWGDGFEIETLINTRIAKAGLRITEVPSYEAERIHGQSNLNTWRDGLRVLRALVVERFNGKGHDVEIVRTEPRDVAPVIQLPVRHQPSRIIRPLDVPAGTVLRETVFVDNVVMDYDPESYDPGPLARALMNAAAAETR
jgi:glycosyltransferase involved in cell wall biosynthesis